MGTQSTKFMCAMAMAGAGAAAATPAAAAASSSCVPDTLKEITVKGTIRFVRSTVRPFIGPDGKADYSIFDTIDEYEVSAQDLVCGPRLRVRFEYGDVQYVACADHVPATVSGFLSRDESDGSVFLSVVSPSGLVCKAPE
jgi:hypothetical protein